MLNFLGDVNWLAVIVCAVFSMIIGFIWYGPLFGKSWGIITGWTKEKVITVPKSKMSVSYILAFLAALIMTSVLALALLATGANGVGEGIIVAVVLWIGFTAATIGVNITFERRPLTLFGIGTGHHLTAILVYTIVLSIW